MLQRPTSLLSLLCTTLFLVVALLSTPAFALEPRSSSQVAAVPAGCPQTLLAIKGEGNKYALGEAPIVYGPKGGPKAGTYDV